MRFVTAMLWLGLGACDGAALPGSSSKPTAIPGSASAATPASSSSLVPPFVAEKVWAEGKAMGTHLAFSAFTTPQVNATAARGAFDRAIKEIERIEAVMTTWRDDSEVSRINLAAGKTPVAIGPETFAILKESIRASEISDGSFDITFEGLRGLWKFDQDLDPHPPTLAQVKARLPLIGWRHIHLDDTARTAFLDQSGVKISLGGIAKGYAVDRAAKVLGDAGLTAYYVQAGGDLFTRGKKPDGSEWSAGIRDPRGPAEAHFAALPVSDHAFSTAGDYERSYVVGGKRYHHIIDPRTGFPADKCRSVTIWAKTALLADSIDDAVFILGPEKGLALVESIDDVGAVIVDAANKVWVSKRLAGKLVIERPPTGGI